MNLKDKGIYTLPSRIKISNGFTRVVIGKRGPYIEFDFSQVIKDTLIIPIKEKWRLHSPTAYYIEYRTVPDNIMIYHQKQCVTYADYKIGMLYVAPQDIIINNDSTIMSGLALCDMAKWDRL